MLGIVITGACTCIGPTSFHYLSVLSYLDGFGFKLLLLHLQHELNKLQNENNFSCLIFPNISHLWKIFPGQEIPGSISCSRISQPNLVVSLGTTIDNRYIEYKATWLMHPSIWMGCERRSRPGILASQHPCSQIKVLYLELLFHIYFRILALD